MTGREALPPISYDRLEVVGRIKGYFNGLIDENLAELYGASNPDELTGQSVGAFEITDDSEPAQDSLMKIWFSAHARAQAAANLLSGSEGAQEMILSAHRRLHIPEAPRLFRIVPGGRERNPHYQMASRLRTANGAEIIRPRGRSHAVAILFGEVVLTDPDYSAMHPDAGFKEQVRALF